ncbi:hypothetical protein J6590_090227 [Homalodisca vitripennis]|nr:hypothetical protein J6590_090227 [Homalodisca vitripennis]
MILMHDVVHRSTIHSVVTTLESSESEEPSQRSKCNVYIDLLPGLRPATNLNSDLIAFSASGMAEIRAAVCPRSEEPSKRSKCNVYIDFLPGLRPATNLNSALIAFSASGMAEIRARCVPSFMKAILKINICNKGLVMALRFSDAISTFIETD